MKSKAVKIFLFIFFAFSAGCVRPPSHPEPPAKTDSNFKKLSFYARYATVKIDIMPLTEFISVDDTRQAKIKLYVSLLDTFGSQIKSPGVFRFELYEYVQRSAEPKGKRIIIWPDIDLTEPADNNVYWRDFLRAYEFNLPFEQAANQSYILQVTCLCPNGRRLSSEFTLRHSD